MTWLIVKCSNGDHDADNMSLRCRRTIHKHGQCLQLQWNWRYHMCHIPKLYHNLLFCFLVTFLVWLGMYWRACNVRIHKQANKLLKHNHHLVLTKLQRFGDGCVAGVCHMSVTCDVCRTNGLHGVRWKCTECHDFDLCHSCYMSNKHDLSHAFIRYDTPLSVG